MSLFAAHRRLAIATIAMAAGAPAAAADRSPDPGTGRFEYRVGAQVFSGFNSVVRLDSRTLGRGTELRLEDDVNLEERVNVARADGVFHFNDRHLVAFSAYDVDRTGTRPIDRDVAFGGDRFSVNTTVTSSVEERIVKAAYGYTPIRRPRYELGPTFGLHVMRLSAGLSAAGTAPADDARTTAPLPVIGVRGQYWFQRRWRLVGGYEWFDVRVGDARGTFRDFIATVEHQTFDRFGFGIGVNDLDLDVESSDAEFTGAIGLSFRSLVVYFKGSLGRRVGR